MKELQRTVEINLLVCDRIVVRICENPTLSGGHSVHSKLPVILSKAHFCVIVVSCLIYNEISKVDLI
jgi:hypothetical protein